MYILFTSGILWIIGQWVIVTLSPADGHDDGNIAEEHHQDGQQPGQHEEVDEVSKLLFLVSQRNRVDALPEHGGSKNV